MRIPNALHESLSELINETVEQAAYDDRFDIATEYEMTIKKHMTEIVVVIKLILREDSVHDIDFTLLPENFKTSIMDYLTVKRIHEFMSSQDYSEYFTAYRVP